MKNIFKDLKRRDHKRYLGGLDVFKYIGPGLLVTVGFIDPGNWASNFAAGSEFGYSLLWVVTLSTIMLIVLQHNVAHLGIVTGLCLSEAATKYTPSWVSRPILGTAVLASISTSLAEILGGAIALQMLFDIPIIWGSILTTVFVVVMLFTNSYKKIERSIIAFVSVIGLSFIYELFLVKIDWPLAAQGWVIPSFPHGSMLIIMSVLGAVVMPHNLFLHSEVIQSHEYNKKDDASIRKVLKYELFDTLFSMIVGWAINSAMILLAAATFFKSGIQVEELQQAKSLLEPLLGSSAAVVFALALLMAGISSTITSGMAAGSIFAGIFGESYHIKDSHSQVGVILSLGIALLLIFFIGDPFKGLLISQMILSIQLPFTVFLQVGLTSSRKSDGAVCKQQMEYICTLCHCCGGHCAEYHAAGIRVDILNNSFLRNQISSMKIITYNVNGLRAAVTKGFPEWLAQEQPDVLCLQETKLQPEQYPAEALDALGYKHYLYSAQKKGYSGVAILSKQEPDHVEYGMGIEEYDNEGRFIRADFGDVSVVSVYHPSGTSGDERQAFKMVWLEKFQEYVLELERTRPKLILAAIIISAMRQ